jgi:hypothetical protein
MSGTFPTVFSLHRFSYEVPRNVPLAKVLKLVNESKIKHSNTYISLTLHPRRGSTPQIFLQDIHILLKWLL